MVGIPIKYTEFYGEAIPDDPIALIANIPKDELITTISAVNTRLKRILSSNFDNSIATQIDCLGAIFNFQPAFRNRIETLIQRFTQPSFGNILFSRVGCLYSYQLILAENQFTNQAPQAYTLEQRENIFKFLLIANEKSITFDSEFNNKGTEELGEDFFDFYMFKQLPFNQYYISFNPINKFYIGWYLFDKLFNDEFYSSHLQEYLKITFNISEITTFFKYIIGQYFQSNDDNFKLSYLRISPEHSHAIKILKKLSINYNFPIPAETDPMILDFLQLKKSPVFWEGSANEKGIHLFIILDGILFIEKIYSLFINDFWFDYLKPKKVCNRKIWGDFVGSVFFEPFIHDIMSRIYKENDRVKYLNSSNLFINVPGKGKVEYIDFYLRDKNKVLLIEAKSQNMPNIDGYKNVNTIEDFQALDKEKFYERYGLYQLAEKTISQFEIAKKSLPDFELRSKGKVVIYPTLILNDPILSLGFSNLAFKKKFERVLKDKGILTNTRDYRIKPLSIINIMELMDMEESLKSRKQTFFNLLDIHISNTSLHRAKSSFDLAKPFSWVINSWIEQKCRISRDILKFKWLGFDRRLKKQDIC